MTSASTKELRRQLAWLRRTNPEAYQDALETIFEKERRTQRAKYEASFLAFVKRAWQEVDPKPLSISWFLECICEHLQLIADGELRSLILNAPPRTGKSLLVSVLYPSWVWCRGGDLVGPQSGAQVSFMCISYASQLSEELAVRMRRLVWGSWYQGVFGDRVKPVLDQASRHNFATTAGGARISSSIESGLLGRGGDIQLLDDLMTLKQAESELETRTVLQAFSEGLPTRVTNSATSTRVLVGQRVSENDVTNLAVETWKDATWLMFPARYEVLRNCPQDRRTVEGELLTPELWPEEELRKVELGLAGLDKGLGALSSFGAAAQLQQSPIVRGGGVIRREDWQIWPEGPAPDPKDLKINARGEYQVMLPLMQYIIVAVDTAYSEREESSMNGVVCLGVWSRRREEVSRAQPWMASRWGTVEPDPAEIEHLLEGQEQPRVILCEAFQTRAPLNDLTPDARTGKPRGLVQRVAEVCRRREANRVVIEDMNRGHDTAAELRRELHGMEIEVELIKPTTSKLARMNSVQPLFSNKLVYSPANLVRTFDKFGKETVEVREFLWVAEVAAQCNRTPRGRQDLADCVSMGLSVLRRDGWLSLTNEFVKEQLEQLAWKPKPGSIGRDIARSYGVY